MNNISLFIYLHCYGPVYANVTPKLGTAHVTAFQELVVYTIVIHTVACFTSEVNGFVQIRAVHSCAGPTTAFGQVVG